MNRNLNTSHLQHQHSQPLQQQQLPQPTGSSGTGDNSNVLVYINHSGDDNSNRAGGMTIHNCSMPPSWVKHQQQQHPPSPAGAALPLPSSPPLVNNSCPSSSTASSTYGAYPQQQTQTFYPVEHPYDENTVVEGRSTQNFNSNAEFYSSEPTSSNYYQNTSSQFQGFDSTKSSNCGGDDENNSPNLNFFNCSSGFYPAPNNHHYNQQTQEYQNHPGVGKYFRSNYSNNNSQVQDSSTYFPGGSHSRIPLPAYGSHQHNSTSEFRVDHSSHPQPMYRRNSIESFSTEPGELAYNTKYNTFNNNAGQFISQSKRDTFISTSWSNTGAGGHSHGPCHGYFFTNHPTSTSTQNHNPSHRHYGGSNNNNFGHQHCGSPAVPGSSGSGNSNVNYTQNQQHQQFVQNFNKSCSFEESGQLTCPSQGGVNVYRAAPLKHRSLSLQYPRSDQLLNRDEQQQQLFQIRTHNFSANTKNSVRVMTEIHRCSESGSSPSPTNHCGENESGSSDCTSNNTSPVPDERTSTSLDRTNTSGSVDESVENNVDDVCRADVNIVNESNDPTQSNLSESNNNNNSSKESSSRCNSSSNSNGNGNAGNLEDGLNKNSIHNVISTTTSKVESTCQQVRLECDMDNDNDLSNSSSLALFDSITLMNTLTSSPLSDNGDDSMSGMSSSESGTGVGHSRHHRDKSPQKISKRSFSEADKDLVINTSAITAAMAFGIRRNISVPIGWKREMSNNSHIFYTSPSSTKLRSWEELKNYVSSDGTCKCGLNCPLWLEHIFSFDPKVRNTCEEEEESLLNLNGKDVKSEETRFCCNHKRKIPSSEDYPLISSTRDDLGDCAMSDRKSSAKKRRISGAHTICSGDTNKYKNLSSLVTVPKTSSPNPQSQNVSVPFSQQSPDTTTQTPQRDMSPASSVSSEPSSASSQSNGNRSTNTTPTPAMTKLSPAATTVLPAKGQRQYEFAWPTTPSPSGIGTTSNRTPTPPCTIVSSNNSGNTKRPGQSYQNYIAPKVSGGIVKRYPPCPNIDVRQIPLEQNRPPPRLNQTIKESLPVTISINPASSHVNQIQNPTVSFIPVTSGTTTQADHNIANMNTGYSDINPRNLEHITSTAYVQRTMAITSNATLSSIDTDAERRKNPIDGITKLGTGLLTGYSISPVIPNVAVSAVSLGTSVNNSTYQFANILPMQIAGNRMVTTSTANSHMLIPQSLPRSITISMVDQQEKSTSPSCVSSSLPTSTTSTVTRVELRNSNIDSLDRVSEKSPLQLVQDVVDRFHTRPGESGISQSNLGSVTANVIPSFKNDSQSVSTTDVVTKSLTPAEVTPQTKEEMKPGISELVASSTVYVHKTMAITSSATLTSIDADAERRRSTPDGITKLETGLTSISIFPSSSSISIQPVQFTNPSSNSTNSCITTTSMSANVPIMAHTPLLSCGNNSGGFNLTNLGSNGNSLILQQQPDHNNQNSLFTTTTAGGAGQSIRYPVFQTLQPIILNSNGTPGSLIISPQSQGTSDHPSFIQIDSNHSHHQATAEMLQHQATATTMMIDPSMCGGVGQSILCGGPKKKKKRLSKKQQQQQAQLQLQQQLLLQQLHQQVQAQQVQAAQQQIPLLFPPSFSLGQQGFSLQPMNMNMNMNFFPTPTILTLPNIILNPDGTLFIQQPSGTPLSATTTTPAGGNLKISNQFPIQTLQPQQQNLIAPKKDNSGILEVVRVNCNSNEISLSSDDSRQNATPDSSTNDCQLGLIASTTPNSTNSITVGLPLSSSTNLPIKKLPLKSKAVSSSSSSVKRILPQKQILPKIDSTTPPGENT